MRTYYPFPEGWGGEGLTGMEWVGLVVFSPVGVYLVVSGIRTIEQYRWPTTAFLISSGVLFLCLCALAPTRQRTRGRLHVDGDEIAATAGRTVIAQSAATTLAMTGLLGCTIVAGSTALAGDVLAELPASASARAPAPIVLAVIVAVTALYLPCYVLNKSIRRLTLTSRAVTVPRGLHLFPTSIAWADIVAITPLPLHESGTLRLDVRSYRHPTPRVLRVDVRFMKIGAPATYWLLRFYHEHPEHRGELNDHRAAERVRTYRLLDVGRDQDPPGPHRPAQHDHLSHDS